VYNTLMQEEPTTPPQSNWQFTPETQAAAPADDSVNWTASEFIAHEKKASWYLLLIVGAGLLAAAVVLLTHDIFSGVMIALAAIALGFFASRQPRTLPYVLDHDGLQIGPKHYAYDLFKSFSVIDEGAVSSITLMPLRRFSPPLSIYYDPKDEKVIANVISSHLPFEPADLDMVERLMRRIHF
jgi:hypothetical protein